MWPIPALPSGKPYRENLWFRSRKRKSWGRDQALLGGSRASWPWQCQMHPDRPSGCRWQRLRERRENTITIRPTAARQYLFRQLTRLLGRVEDFIVEHWEVEGQPEPDGVGGLHFVLADLKRFLVGFLRVVNNGCNKLTITFSTKLTICSIPGPFPDNQINNRTLTKTQYVLQSLVHHQSTMVYYTIHRKVKIIRSSQIAGTGS